MPEERGPRDIVDIDHLIAPTPRTSKKANSLVVEKVNDGINLLNKAQSVLKLAELKLGELKQIIDEAKNARDIRLKNLSSSYRKGEVEIQQIFDQAHYDDSYLFNHRGPLDIVVKNGEAKDNTIIARLTDLSKEVTFLKGEFCKPHEAHILTGNNDTGSWGDWIANVARVDRTSRAAKNAADAAAGATNPARRSAEQVAFDAAADAAHVAYHVAYTAYYAATALDSLAFDRDLDINCAFTPDIDALFVIREPLGGERALRIADTSWFHKARAAAAEASTYDFIAAKVVLAGGADTRAYLASSADLAWAAANKADDARKLARANAINDAKAYVARYFAGNNDAADLHWFANARVADCHTRLVYHATADITRAACAAAGVTQKAANRSALEADRVDDSKAALDAARDNLARAAATFEAFCSRAQATDHAAKVGAVKTAVLAFARAAYAAAKLAHAAAEGFFFAEGYAYACFYAQ